MILAKKRRRLLVYAHDVQLIFGFKGSFSEFMETDLVRDFILELKKRNPGLPYKSIDFF